MTLDDTLSRDNLLELTLCYTCNLMLIMSQGDKHVLRTKKKKWYDHIQTGRSQGQTIQKQKKKEKEEEKTR